MSASGDWVDKARQFFGQDLWQRDLETKRVSAAAIRLLQLAVMMVEGFVRDQLLVRASALTYITALAVIPLLAVALSILKALGVSENLAELAINNLAAGSPGAREQLLGLVQSATANIGGLGTVGVAVLVITTVLALRHLEATLNDVWGVQRPRSWSRRFSDYLAVFIVAPLSVGVALSLATTLQSGPIVSYLLEFPLFSTLYDAGLEQLPRIMIFFGFTFLYWFFPNTNVRIGSAALGAVVAALLLSVAQWGYVGFSVGAARYNTLFGTFAALPLLLVWIYVCWAIVLFGAELSFAFQNLARYRREVRSGDSLPAEQETVALELGVEIARVFRNREAPPTAGDLADTLDVPMLTIRNLLGRLEQAGIVAPRSLDDREHGYQLGRPAEDVTVDELLHAVRGDRFSDGRRNTEHGEGVKVVSDILQEFDERGAELSRERTLHELIDQLPAPRASKAD